MDKIVDGQSFSTFMELCFSPFLAELGFSPPVVRTSGRAYLASFHRKPYKLSVSFEPGDDYFSVVVIDSSSAYPIAMDDLNKSPRLRDLNARYMHLVSKEEIEANDAWFQAIVPKDDEEDRLLGFARELRLVLPRFLAE